MVKLIENYPRGENELKALSRSHVYLKLSELELMEFERTFLTVKEKTREYHAKVRVVFGDFTKYLRDNNGISSSLFFEKDGGLISDYDYYNLISNIY